MRPRAALPESAKGRAILGPLRHRPEEEQLVQRQFSLEDVPLAQARDALDVRRRQHLLAHDQRLDVRRVARQRLDHRVAERVALRVVPAAGDVVWRVLDEDAHHVLARRRHPGIDHRADHDVHVRTAREASVLRVVVGTLEILHARRDRERAACRARRQRGIVLQAGELWKTAEREIHLATRAAELVPFDSFDQVGGKRARVEQLHERASRVESRDHDRRTELVAVPADTPLRDLSIGQMQLVAFTVTHVSQLRTGDYVIGGPFDRALTPDDIRPFVGA